MDNGWQRKKNLMEPGQLIKTDIDELVLWPRYDSESYRGTSFNKFPHLKKGEFLMIIEDPYGPQIEGSHRVRVLSSKGEGWVSFYAIADLVA